jgi:hypothetical protein
MKPSYEIGVQLPLLSSLWLQCNDEPYRSSDHSRQTTAIPEGSRRLQLAYCALDKGQGVHFFGVSIV